MKVPVLNKEFDPSRILHMPQRTVELARGHRLVTGSVVAAGLLLGAAADVQFNDSNIIEKLTPFGDNGANEANVVPTSGSETTTSTSSTTTPEKDKAAEVGCETSTFEAVAANASQYESEAFLPKTDKVNSDDDVAPYIKSLFGKKGPLGTKIDKGSLSAMMATFTKPAHDGAKLDPNYNFKAEFGKSMSSYGENVPGALEKAQEDCALTQKTLEQISTYKKDWGIKGRKYGRITAVRDAETNVITGYTVDDIVVGENLSGIRLALDQTNRGIDGFEEGLIETTTGDIWVKGVTAGQKGTINFETGTAGTEEGNGAAGDNPGQTGGGGEGDATGNGTHGRRGGGGDTGTGEGNCNACHGTGGGSGNNPCTACGRGTQPQPAPGTPTTPGGSTPAPGTPSTPGGQTPAPSNPETPGGQTPTPGNPQNPGPQNPGPSNPNNPGPQNPSNPQPTPEKPPITCDPNIDKCASAMTASSVVVIEVSPNTMGVVLSDGRILKSTINRAPQLVTNKVAA